MKRGDAPNDASVSREGFAPQHGERAAPAVDALDWSKGQGLLPAIVQHADTHVVLMLGYMNREAYSATLASGRVTFWSRSRGTLWCKGETSGNVLDVVTLAADCDADTLLVQARPRGPVCHRGTPTCFDRAAADDAASVDAVPVDAVPIDDVPNVAATPGLQSRASQSTPPAGDPVNTENTENTDPIAFFATLDALIARRAAERPDGSYTTRLLDAGVARIAQKVGEEGVETALAAVTRDDAGLVDEAADLVYHLVVLLRARGLSFETVAARLSARHS